MNAERFDSKEYQDLQRVDFIRVCSLSVGQSFLMSGAWRYVHSIEDGRIYYYTVNGRTKESLGANSQMFVQIIKEPTTVK